MVFVKLLQIGWLGQWPKARIFRHSFVLMGKISKSFQTLINKVIVLVDLTLLTES